MCAWAAWAHIPPTKGWSGISRPEGLGDRLIVKEVMYLGWEKEQGHIL
jgi:hypothetical protein